MLHSGLRGVDIWRRERKEERNHEYELLKLMIMNMHMAWMQRDYNNSRRVCH